MPTQKKLTFKILIIQLQNISNTTVYRFQWGKLNFFRSRVEKKDIIKNKQIATLQLTRQKRKVKDNNQVIFVHNNNCFIIVYDSKDRKPLNFGLLEKLIFEINQTENPLTHPIFVIQYNYFEKNEMIKSYLVEQQCKQNRIYNFFRVSAQDYLSINRDFKELIKIMVRGDQHRKIGKLLNDRKLNYEIITKMQYIRKK